MELILLAIIGVLLLVGDRYANFYADQLAGTAFEQIHEVVGNVSYFGQAAKPVIKQHKCITSMPLCPSVNHDIKVLCLTECGHWFWFMVTIRKLDIEKAEVKPATEDEARKALAHEPDMLEQYFPATQANSDDTEHHKKSA